MRWKCILAIAFFLATLSDCRSKHCKANKSSDIIKFESFHVCDMEGQEYNKQHKFPLRGTKNVTVRCQLSVVNSLPREMDLSLSLVGYGSFIFQFHKDLPCPLKNESCQLYKVKCREIGEVLELGENFCPVKVGSHTYTRAVKIPDLSKFSRKIPSILSNVYVKAYLQIKKSGGIQLGCLTATIWIQT